jgi:hypothetical protein
VWVNPVRVFVLDSRRESPDVDCQDDELTWIQTIKEIRDLNQILVAVGAVDETIGRIGFGQVLFGVRLAIPDFLRRQVQRRAVIQLALTPAFGQTFDCLTVLLLEPIIAPGSGHEQWLFGPNSRDWTIHHGNSRRNSLDDARRLRWLSVQDGP